jgi:hypothetical protein
MIIKLSVTKCYDLKIVSNKCYDFRNVSKEMEFKYFFF